MLEELSNIFTLSAFVWFNVGTIFGIFVVSIINSMNGQYVEACPKCHGVAGFQTAPNDWHDCDMCDATGKVLVKS